MVMEKVNDENDNVAQIPDDDTTPIYEFITRMMPGQHPYEAIGVVRTVKKHKKPKGLKKHEKFCIGEKNTRSLTELNENMSKITDPGALRYFTERVLNMKAEGTQRREERQMDANSNLKYWITNENRGNRFYMKTGFTIHNVWSVFLKHVPDLYVIDEDVDVDKEDATTHKYNAEKLCVGCPYTMTRKGRHYYVFIHNVPKLQGSCKDVFQTFEGDFLGVSGNNVWEQVIQPNTDKPNCVYNFTAMEDIPRWDWNDIVVQKEDKDDQVFKTSALRTWKQLPSQQQEPEPSMETEDDDGAVTKASVRLKEHPNFVRHKPPPEDLKLLLDCAGDPDCGYDEWFRIGAAVKGFGDGKDYFDVFNNWSKPGATYNEKATKDAWNSYWNTNPDANQLGWNSLRMLFETKYPEGWADYKQRSTHDYIKGQHAWGSRELVLLSMLEMGQQCSRTVDTDFIAVDNVRENSSHVFRFNKRTGFWDEHRHAKTLMEGYIEPIYNRVHKQITKQKKIMEGITDKEATGQAQGKLKKMMNLLTTLNEASRIQAASTHLHTMAYNPEMADALDNNDETKGGRVCFLFPFKDKVVELLTGVVRLPVRDDRTTSGLTTGYPYPEYYRVKDADGEYLPGDAGFTKDWHKKVKKIMRWMETLLETRVAPTGKTYPADADRGGVVDWLLNELACALPAKNLWTHMIWCTGVGSNGKSRFFTFLNNVFGHHGGFLRNTYWTNKSGGGDETDTEIFSVRKHRITFSAEFEDKMLQEHKVKAVTGGDKIKARPIFGQAEEFEAFFTAFAAVNNIPKFNSSDRAMERRFFFCKFPYSFGKEQRKQPNYSKGMTKVEQMILDPDMRDAMVLLLIKTFTETIVKDGEIPDSPPYDVPKSVMADNKSVKVANQDHFDDFILWAFTQTGDDRDSTSRDEMKKVYNDYCKPPEGFMTSDEAYVARNDKLNDAKLHARCLDSYEFSGSKKSYIGLRIKLPSERGPRQGEDTGTASDEAETEESSDETSEDDSD